MSRQIKTIIFDLSEVLISGLCGVEDAIAARVGGSPADILSALGGEPLLSLCRGELTEDGYWNSVLAQAGWPMAAAELKQLSRVNFARKIDHMEDLLPVLAAHYELVLLSDHGREWVEHIRELHPHLGIFQRQIYSFQIRQTKREPSTFQRVLEMIQRRADECVFIDDSLGNVESARSVGLNAFQFTDARTLLVDLEAASVFCPPIKHRTTS